MPVSKLHEVERKVSAPRASPVTDHRREKSSILISTPGVTLALVPDDTANRKAHERRDHRVVKHARIVLVTDANRFRTRAPIGMLWLERLLDFVIPNSTQRDRLCVDWSNRKCAATTETTLTGAVEH